MKRSLFCAVALALSGTIAAHAGEMNQPRRMVVHYDDINVQQAAGAQILLARIDAAADDVCGPAPNIRELYAWQAYKTCTADAASRAIASLPFDLMARLDPRNNSETIAQR